jgi:hypothetical protein
MSFRSQASTVPITAAASAWCFPSLLKRQSRRLKRQLGDVGKGRDHVVSAFFIGYLDVVVENIRVSHYYI